MLTILLNPSNPEPLYQQICTAIREDIAQGVLHPDEKLLPPCSFRTLANQHSDGTDCL